MLTVLLFRGFSLEGADIGINHFMTPNFTKLLDVTLWQDAGTQALYSYGIGFGGLVAMGSHNKPGQNCLRWVGRVLLTNFEQTMMPHHFRDAVLLCCAGVVTSILSSFAIFAILGHMAHAANKPFAEVVKPGIHWISIQNNICLPPIFL
jgi:solute carrier family 6 (neurotransmitter transporter, GABA) member 1